MTSLSFRWSSLYRLESNSESDNPILLGSLVDESSNLNNQCNWSGLPNGRGELEFDQYEHMQYIELLPAVDFTNTNNNSNHQVIQHNLACATRQTSTLASNNTIINDDGHHQHDNRLCLSMTSPSIGGSSSATNDLAILSPSSLTNTTSSQTDSILRSSSGCPIAKQDSSLYNDSTMKRNDLSLVNGGHRTNPSNTCQLTSILKNSNPKLDHYEADCQCNTNHSANIEFDQPL